LQFADVADSIVSFRISEEARFLRCRSIFELLRGGADHKHAVIMRNVDLPMLAPLVGTLPLQDKSEYAAASLFAAHRGGVSVQISLRSGAGALSSQRDYAR
jgi:hypothetical protein